MASARGSERWVRRARARLGLLNVNYVDQLLLLLLQIIELRLRLDVEFILTLPILLVLLELLKVGSEGGPIL